MTYDGNSPTHADPTITDLQLFDALWQRDSPAWPSGKDVWQTLRGHNIDPAFALAQFWAESLYGTAGWATLTGSWGNQLWASTLLSPPHSVRYDASNGLSYAKYATWADAIEDYCRLIDQYAAFWTGASGDTRLIYWATAKWIGADPGSQAHLDYLGVVLWRMNQYATVLRKGVLYMIEYVEGQTIVLHKGTPLCDEVGGTPWMTYQGADSRRPAYRISGTTWVAILVNTGHKSPTGQTRPAFAYIANVPDSALLKSIKAAVVEGEHVDQP